MGTWEGHISPGVAFYSFGIVFCVQNSWAYFTRGRKFHRMPSKTNTKFGKVYSKVRQFPLDSFMKIIYGFGAAMAELFYPPGTNKLILLDSNGNWVHMNEWQHFTMYSAFMISGIVDIISQKLLKERETTLEKTIIAMAFYITALLLFFHKHGKGELELEAHGLLLYANLAVCASLTLEVWRPFDQKLIWLHTLLIMQMGSWLFHLAYILFRPIGGEKWDSNNMHNLMILPIFYSWHIILNCTVMGIIHVLTWIYYRYRVSSSYSRIDNSELQCCMPSHSDDNDSTNGGTFRSDFDGTNSRKRLQKSERRLP
uniref:transmembrane protein 45B-like isoform X1 n=1 Tax=Styela clava TaxID=7725 RepID=UPI00193A65C0|nr:transmembrane protein 45B-like isoform X1 [Styela clava]XP_039270327.1 transmembrane protein 45B-like isoform X2 [Styela clava]